MGLLVNGNGTYNISILRNAFIHNYGRNPRVKANGTVDVINNVIYNYGYGGGFSSNNGNLSVNYIGNFVIRGKNSKKGEIRPSIFEARVYPPEIGNSISIYVEGNIGPNRLSVFDKEAAVVDPEGRKYITSARSPRLHSIPAMKAYVEVLADAGVSQGIDSSGRKLFRRDPVDIRLVNDVRKRIGGIIDDPAEVGGWPLIEKGDGIVDSDHDGMPDVYEIMNGFKHLDPVDGSGDADEDGYTNLEEYLNGTVPIKNAH